MQSLTPYVVAFATGVGALIDGGHGAIVAATLTLGVILVVAFIGAIAIAKQVKEGQAALAHDLQQGGATWPGVPDEVTGEDIAELLQKKMPEDPSDTA